MGFSTVIVTLSEIYEGNMIITDRYYADIYDENGSFCNWGSNDNDLFGELGETGEIDTVGLRPDLYIGRVVCSDDQEVKVLVNKIINYENGGSIASLGCTTYPWTPAESYAPHSLKF